MEYQIQEVPARTLAGFHLVGPWEQTVQQGFEQLNAWVNHQKYPAQEWIAVYFDNPQVTPPEERRCETAITVAEDFIIPPNSEGMILTRLEGGLYAVAQVSVVNDDFFTPWNTFFAAVASDTRYQLREAPSFEIYLSDGADGIGEIAMYLGVTAIQERAA